MAVIKGIEVTVEANGQVLQEYDDLENDHGTGHPDHGKGMPFLHSKYIEATSGTRFIITTVVPESVQALSEGLSLEVVLDGVLVEDRYLMLDRLDAEDGVWQERIDGSCKPVEAGWVARPFMFRELKCSADTSSRVQGNLEAISIEDLGTIRVKIWRRTNFRRGTCEMDDFEVHVTDVGVLDEKLLKGTGLTHTVSLGEELVPEQEHEIWDSDYLDDEDSPFAVFNFKCCSKKALQSLLLVPRTPSPESTPPLVALEERPVEELTLEELRKLVKRQRAKFQAECAARVKPERDIKVEKGIGNESGIKKGCDKKVKLEPENKAVIGTISENNSKGGYDAKVDELLASIRSELDDRRAHDAKVGELLASIKSGFGTKRKRDEELDDLLASATSKKVKGPIANGEIVDLSD